MATRPVNLIEDKLAERAAFREQSLRIAASCLLCILVGCILVSVLRVANARASGRLQAVMAQKRILDQRQKYLQGSKDRLSKEHGELLWAVEIRDANRKWRGTLFELGRNTPDGVFINQIATEKTAKGPSLNISGTAVSLDQVAALISNMSRSAVFDSVQLESTQAGEINGVPTVSFRCYALVGQLAKR